MRILGGVELVLREWGRHHAEDCVKSESAQRCEATDIAEPELP